MSRCRKRRAFEVARAAGAVAGQDGTFDDSGVGVGCVIETDDGFALYYMGWNLGVRSPWRNAIGLARSPTLQGSVRAFFAGADSRSLA